MSERVYAGESAADRQARRRRQLLDAGLELFGTQGYRASTVRQVCREAAVADRYFYQEFPQLEDLLLAVYDECVGRLMAAASAAIDPAEQDVEAIARAGLGAFLEVVESDRRLARVVWFEVLGVTPRVERAYLSWMDDFGRLVLDLMAARDRVPEQDQASLDVLSAAVVGGISHAVVTWVSRDLVPSREEVVEVLARLLAGAADAFS